MYTKQLTTNLKGRIRTYDLTDKVLIVGDNEAGKSAITQSLQLAYSGAATGLLFRDEVKLASALLTMAPPGLGLDIVAIQDTGEKFTYSLPRGKKPKHTGPVNVNVDSSDIREAFSGSVDRMLAFLGTRIEADGYAEALSEYQAALATVKEHKAALKEADTKLSSVGNPEVVTKEDIKQLVSLLGFTSVIRTLAANSPHGTVLHSALRMVGEAYGTEHFTKAKPLTVDDVINKAKAYKDWAVIKETVRAKDEIEVEVLKATQVAEKAEQVYYDKTKELVALFEAKVLPFLQHGESLDIDLASGYARLVRSGYGYAALSGSTEARVLAAMACALSMPSLPGVIVLDDRMWSMDNLMNTMLALGSTPCQVIITSTVAIDAPGWQILRV